MGGGEKKKKKKKGEYHFWKGKSLIKEIEEKRGKKKKGEKESPSAKIQNSIGEGKVEKRAAAPKREEEREKEGRKQDVPHKITAPRGKSKKTREGGGGGFFRNPHGEGKKENRSVLQERRKEKRHRR